MDSPTEAPRRHPGRTLIGFTSLLLAILQSICTAAVAISGFRVLFGLGSLISATAAGPAHGFHSNKIRLTFLLLAAAGAAVNLWLYWNESRLRNNPAAQWRISPMDRKMKIRRRLQLWLAVTTLVLVAVELITHPWFHHES
jgi:hypothetical protein